MTESVLGHYMALSNDYTKYTDNTYYSHVFLTGIKFYPIVLIIRLSVTETRLIIELHIINIVTYFIIVCKSNANSKCSLYIFIYAIAYQMIKNEGV